MNHATVLASLAILELALLALVIALECKEARRNAEQIRILRRILGPDYIDRDAIRCRPLPALTWVTICALSFTLSSLLIR